MSNLAALSPTIAIVDGPISKPTTPEPVWFLGLINGVPSPTN